MYMAFPGSICVWKTLGSSVLILQGLLSDDMLSGTVRETFQHQEYFSYPLTGAMVTPIPLVLMQHETWPKGKRKRGLLRSVSESECTAVGTVAGEVG